ncbi:LPS translocon maturation chaperone LptM [Paracidovorax wautersii]|uniref:LPS translocon maturation chaperone LptM n=1 Tax=Paracidovorax wautersii TaxID=1177982 RepID=UPI000A455DE3|nr:lipoprotein [Paracidovorax wautersii]
MLRASQILVRALVLAGSAAAIAGCGQRGPLYLPTEPAAAQRATLPQTVLPFLKQDNSSTPTPAAPSAPASAPADPASSALPSSSRP